MTHDLDPGTVGNHEDNWPFQTFMMTVTILGLVVVSTLIGLISSGILNKIDELRKGRSFVIESDHVLILHRGSIVESGSSEEIVHQPKHSYTRKLVASTTTM